MKCPFCNKELISGFVQARGDIYFTTAKHKLLFSASGDDVTLSRNNMTAPTCTAYRCSDCRKVIIEY